ncbi:hypothetical protein BH09PAT3_BH09PAT3_0080 [soil metagenome]
MNTNALIALAGRWPNDAMPVENVQQVPMLMQIMSDPGGSFKRDLLKFNPEDSQAIQQFALDNGFTYSQHAQLGIPKVTLKNSQNQPAWFGMWQNLSMPILTHEVTGMLDGFNITLNLDYGQSGSRHSNNDSDKEDMMGQPRSVIRVKLPALFPQLVLDSHANNSGLSSNMNVSFDTSQRVSLEGDFDKYFNFFVPKGLQIDALSVLAPNFMQLVIDSSQLFDVEFYGDELILVTSKSIYDPAVMRQVELILQEQLRYMRTLLLSWRYTPKRQPFDLLQRSRVSGSVMRIGSHTIQPYAQVLIISLFIFLFCVVMIFFV